MVLVQKRVRLEKSRNSVERKTKSYPAAFHGESGMLGGAEDERLNKEGHNTEEDGMKGRLKSDSQEEGSSEGQSR